MTLNEYAEMCRVANDTWWKDIVTGEKLDRNKGELMMLIVSEVAESFEGVRKNLPDDKLPQFPMEAVEMVDVLIRVFDYCGEYGWDLDKIFKEKLRYNAERADHKVENRLLANGKKF